VTYSQEIAFRLDWSLALPLPSVTDALPCICLPNSPLADQIAFASNGNPVTTTSNNNMRLCGTDSCFPTNGQRMVLMALWLAPVLTASIQGGQPADQSGIQPILPAPYVGVRPPDVPLHHPNQPLTNGLAQPGNRSNAVEQSSPFQEDIDHYQRELQKTDLAPQLRSAYSMLLQQYIEMNIRFRNTPNVRGPHFTPRPILAGDTVPLSVPNPSAVSGGPTYQQMMAEHATNAQLWANLFDAQVKAHTSNDKELAATAEKQLADFLAVQLGKGNKKISPGMSLPEIMKANGAPVHEQKPDRRKLVLAILSGVILAPVISFANYKLKHRRV
jgi:hypothetical protein